MAKTSSGKPVKNGVYVINGIHHPTGAGAAPMSFEINGSVTDLPNLMGSHHAAACLAALAALVDADGRDVTHVEIKGPPLFVNHAEDVWARTDPLLATLHPAIELLESRFDHVAYC